MPERPTRDFWDKQSMGRILQNMFNRMGIQKILGARFTRKKHQIFGINGQRAGLCQLCTVMSMFKLSLPRVVASTDSSEEEEEEPEELELDLDLEPDLLLDPPELDPDPLRDLAAWLRL